MFGRILKVYVLVDERAELLVARLRHALDRKRRQAGHLDPGHGNLRLHELLAQLVRSRLRLDAQRVVGLDFEHQMHAALEVESQMDLGPWRRKEKHREECHGGNNQDLPAKVLVHGLQTAGVRLDDRLLPLVARNGRTGDLDSDLVGDLNLDGLVIKLGHKPINAACGDDLVAYLQAGLKVLNLLLALPSESNFSKVQENQSE